jgi:SAM-dependent methyltransferase
MGEARVRPGGGSAINLPGMVPRSAAVLGFLAALLTGCGGGKASGPAGEQAGHEHHGPVGHRFERAEDWAKFFDDPGRAEWQKPDEVVALAELSQGMTAVDLGAGTGYFLSRLSRAVGPGGAVIATDIEPDMVRYMKERAAREKLTNVQALVAPADDVGIPPETADRILIVDVWHHIADREQYAARLARALKPSGAVVIVDFTLESRRGPPRLHRLAPERVVAELGAGGLAAKLADETLPDQ